MFNNELWQKPAGGAGGSTFYDYQIANSFRWTDGAAYLTRTPSAAGNRQTWTFSCWMKASGVNVNSQGDVQILGAGSSGNQDTRFRMYFYNSQLYSSSNEANYNTSPGVYRDASAWYHVVWKLTGGTSYQYVNGTLASSVSVSGNVAINNNVEHLLGILPNLETISKFKGYMAEVVFIDGTALDPTSFAESKNGVWIPKDPSTLTFGSQGYHLDFADASAPGNDVSGNNNDWTNVSLATHDQTLDSPTFGSSSTGNCCTLNPLTIQSGLTISEGNLKMSRSSAGNIGIPATMGASVGKYYFEVYWNNDTQVGNYAWGFIEPDSTIFGSNTAIAIPDTYNLRVNSGDAYINGAGIITMNGTTPTTGTIIGIAIDFDNGKIFYGQDGGSGSRSMNWNNSDTGTGVPDAGTNPAQTFTVGTTFVPAFSISSIGDTNWILNFGQSSAFSGALTSQGNTDGNGQGDFYYSPPTGFTGWTTGGLQTADAVDPAQTDDNYPQELFFMSQYTGNSTNRTITTENQPDLIFNRHWNYAQDWYVVDSTRGITANKYLNTNLGNAEATLPQGNFTSVGATSVGISSGTWLNSTGSYYQMWMWRANGGTTAANSVGGTASVTQVDPSGGFSIVTYTGFSGASGSSTVGHGLSVAPAMVIHKSRTRSSGWWTQVPNLLTNAGYFLDLSGTGAQTDLNSYGTMNVPTTSVFTINGVDGVGGESANYVAYCFANIEGYCKVGSYVGNANDDGTFVYTGFRPAMVIMKERDSADDWVLYDDRRVGYNLSQSGNTALYPNDNYAQDNYFTIDILSNGFKLRTSSATINAGSANYIYISFAQNPFQYATAR